MWTDTANEADRRVVIGDPSPLGCDALKAGLEHDAAMTVVGRAGEGGRLLEEWRQHQPDVVLVAFGLPGGTPSVCARLKSAGLELPHAPTRVIVIDTVPNASRLVAVLEAGADGYIPRTSRLSDLIAAIETTLLGRTYVPPTMLGGVLRQLVQRRRDGGEVVERYAQLSHREREIMALLTAGWDDSAMASALFLSQHTIRAHIQNTLHKLGLHRRDEAVAMIAEHDLLSRFPPNGGDGGR